MKGARKKYVPVGQPDGDGGMDGGGRAGPVEKRPLAERLVALKGLALMAASAVAFSLMTLAVRLSGDVGLPSLAVAFWRSLGAGLLVALSLVHSRMSGRDADDARTRLLPADARLRRLLVVRGFVGFLGLSCYTYGITHLPLADAIVLHFCSPMFTLLIAAVMVREPLRLVHVLAGLVNLLGVICVSRPGFLSFIFGSAAGDPLPVFGVVMALSGAVFSAFTNVLVRSIGKAVDSRVVILYFAGIACLLSAPSALVFQSFPFPWSLRLWGLIALMAVTGFIGQVCKTRGLQLEAAGPAAMVRNLDVVLGFIYQATIMDDGGLSLWSVFGGTLVIIATCLIGVEKWRRAEREKLAAEESDAPEPEDVDVELGEGDDVPLVDMRGAPANVFVIGDTDEEEEEEEEDDAAADASDARQIAVARV